jgi:hypothetical protein
MRRRTSGARSTCPFKFPSDILMNQLIDLYFIHQNIYLPLLHRPTFERGIAEGLHLRFVVQSSVSWMHADRSLKYLIT